MRAHRSPTAGATGRARLAEWGKSVAAARQNVRAEWLKRKHRIITTLDLEECRRVSRYLSSVESSRVALLSLLHFCYVYTCDSRVKEDSRETQRVI